MLVGLSGLAGHGKSTVAKYLSQLLGYRTYALASPIKNFFRCLFLWDSEHLYGELKETDCITPFISANEIVQALRTAQIPLEEYHVVLNFFAEFAQFVHEEAHFDGYPSTQYKVSPRRAMQILTRYGSNPRTHTEYEQDNRAGTREGGVLYIRYC